MTNKAFDPRWKSPAVVAISVIAIAASLWSWRKLDSSNGQSAVPVAPATSQQPDSAVEPTEAPAIGDKTSSIAKVDSKRVDELAAALNSGDVDEQIEAINLFAKVGTPEQKAAIVAEAANRDANVAVRVVAVENIVSLRGQKSTKIGVCRKSPLTGRFESYGAQLWIMFEFTGISAKEQRRFKHDFGLH